MTWWTPPALSAAQPRLWWRSAAPTEVYACASHGVLSGPAIQRIEDSVIKEVLFLDTIPAKEGVKCDKIKYLSAAPMLADAISFIYHEDSVSRLFV